MDHPTDISVAPPADVELALAAHASAGAAALGAVVVECGLHRMRGSAIAHVVVHAANGMDAAKLGELTHDLQFRLGVEPVLDSATLEVSTPGINRTLKADAEFAMFVGKAVRLLVEDTPEWREGLIAAVADGGVTLEPLADHQSQPAAVIPLAQIRKAQLTGAEWEPRRSKAIANAGEENTDVE